MWKRYDEPLSLTEMAESAVLSKFYFSRVFRSLTGISPGRFLTAVRIAKAKQLLLETSLSVTDISYMVGYNSLGTFTSRFTRSVGVPPARYRMLSDIGVPPITAPYPSPIVQAKSSRFGAVVGKVTLPETDTPVRVYVGAFNGPVVEGIPASCDILDCSGGYELSRLPEGRWFVRAAAVAVRDTDVDPRPWLRTPLYVASGHASVSQDRGVDEVDLVLRRFTPLDLPVLLALPELDNRCLPELLAAV
jgi:AraC family transcriptional regulator